MLLGLREAVITRAMRVIAGTAKGRTLIGPKSHAIRPALDKVKGAVFNILFDVSDQTALDVFAGTGAIGVEALSRGARRAVFLDASPEALQIIQKNVSLCRFADRADILKAKLPDDLKSVARKTGIGRFDLIFVDPPYDKDLVNPTLREIAKLGILTPDGQVIVEHSPRETILETAGLILKDQRKYGQTMISFLEAKKNLLPGGKAAA